MVNKPLILPLKAPKDTKGRWKVAKAGVRAQIKKKKKKKLWAQISNEKIDVTAQVLILTSYLWCVEFFTGCSQVTEPVFILSTP